MIVVDTPAAIRFATSQTGSSDRALFTDNPMLAKAADIQCLERLLDPDTVMQVGRLSLSLAKKINEVVAPIVDPGIFVNDRPVSVERAIRVLVAALLHRSAVLASGVEVHRPAEVTLIVHKAWGSCENQGYDVGRFAHPYPVLADAGFLEGIPYQANVVEAASEGAHNDTASSSLLARLAVIPLDVLVDMATRRFIRARRIEKTDKFIPVLGDSELLREIGPELRKSGWTPVPYKGAAAASKPDVPLDIEADKLSESVSVLIERFLAEHMSAIFSSGQRAAIETALTERITAGAPYMSAAIKAGADYAEQIHSQTRQPKVVLTSAMSHAACSAFHKRAQSLNMSVVLCEHGIAKGLAGLSTATLSSSELPNCDVFLALTPRSAGMVTGQHPVTKVVGSPDQVRKARLRRIQRHLTRRRLSVARRDIVVFHVSTLPFYSNQRPGFSVGSESQIFDLEASFLRNVYAKIDKKVLFKSYPTRRFPFHPTMASLFPEIRNVSDVGMEDFRYLRSAADVIVTGTATSTIAWCLGANVPVIWWHSENISPVLPDILPEFEKSLLCFNADASDFADSLRELLNRPLEQIQQEWEAKKAARDAFLTEAIFGPAEKAGRVAARYIDTVATAPASSVHLHGEAG